MSEGWIAVADRLPKIGERVEVRHELNHSYDCTGEYKGEGEWSCANAFLVPPCFLLWNPTHWRPLTAARRFSDRSEDLATLSDTDGRRMAETHSGSGRSPTSRGPTGIAHNSPSSSESH